MIGIIACLVILSATFNLAAHHAPAISNKDTLSFDVNSACQAYTKAPNFSSWNCMQCSQVNSVFCASSENDVSSAKCPPLHASFSIAAVSSWCANLTVSESFLGMTKTLGSCGTFLLFAGLSFIGLEAIHALVPETKGLQFEKVEKLLQKGFKPFPFDCKRKDNKGKEQDLA
ncbi:hypothetical protein VNO77_01844 [Canavalia gladiata]|uniref:Uncharacterized protein n=1 Tax=Canavalia gladiata TaxID=3824 RepID=A0AAN9MS47_CANGL